MRVETRRLHSFAAIRITGGRVGTHYRMLPRLSRYTPQMP